MVESDKTTSRATGVIMRPGIGKKVHDWMNVVAEVEPDGA